MQSKSKASLLWHGNRLKPNTAFGYIGATFLSEEMSESRYGIAVFVNSMAVYVKTRKLPQIVLSSTEAEYVALVLGGIFFHVPYKANGSFEPSPSSGGSLCDLLLEVMFRRRRTASMTREQVCGKHRTVRQAREVTRRELIGDKPMKDV